MPAPYALLDMPPGDFKNMFDYPAINMAAAHNSFIQGLNSIIAHAPHISGDKVKPFVFFCIVLIENIHHHHDLEETFYFPAMEKKLGPGTMTDNAHEHEAFVPQLLEFEKWLKEVHADNETYDAAVFSQKVNAFADTMVEHLSHEVATLNRDRIKECFTEKELKDIDSEFMSIAMKKIDFYTTLPLTVVCANPATPWFPPFPAPLKWATRWWFARRHGSTWDYGAMDLAGNPQQLPPIPQARI